jgi:hypothetical protein
VVKHLPARPCLALPFTIVTAPNRVRLIAGEDFRYTLDAHGLETWLPDLLANLDGRLAVEQLLAALPEERRTAAQQLLSQMYGERILIDGPAPQAHRPMAYRLCVEGQGDLLAGWNLAPQMHPDAPEVAVLCQDSLDYEEALRFNERALQSGKPWLWVTSGPMNRGYVSQAFLPDAGPCLACLLGHFQRLSPAVELYTDLIDHVRQGKTVRPLSFPPYGIAILQQLLLWKVELLQLPEPPAALFQLHVLELASLEVTAHRVFYDPECLACRGKR